MYLAALRGLWGLSFPIRDQTCALAVEVWSLHHWTTSESLK